MCCNNFYNFFLLDTTHFSEHEHMNQIVGHNLRFNGSYRSMENVAKIVNSTPNSTIKVPETKYLIKKYMQPKFKYETYIKCHRCSNLTASFESEARCNTCDIIIKTAKSDYFVYIPIEEQLVDSIKENIDEIISYYEIDREQDYMRDIFDSKMFLQIKENYPGYIILPLIVNTDGAKVFNSNSKSLWMIQSLQGWLPPSIRFHPKNVLLCAARFGAKKPNMRDFFYPLLKDLREIYNKGGLKLNHNNKTLHFMPIIFSCCCDLPAKADVQGMCGHSGYFACYFCLHPGIPVAGEKKSVIRYIKGSDDYQLRSHSNTVATYQQLRSVSIQGVKKMSCMLAAKDFDLIFSFSVDYMHCVLLGIMKKMLNLWLDTSNHKEPYYIEKKYQIALSKRLLNIKPISDIIRKPRSIFSRGEFKANEFRSLLFYYLWFALDGLLNEKCVIHFRLLSTAVYLLSKEIISTESIERARILLNDFANQFEALYGKSNVTTNLHLLRHVTMQVENLGPLWSQSAFAFEANNGIAVKSNASTKDIVHQIMWKYSMRKTIKTIANVPEYSLGGKAVIKISPNELKIFEESKIRAESSNFLTVYKSVVIRGVKYTSLQSKEISTIDYFVRLKDDKIGAVKYYTIIDFTLYAIINTYQVIDMFEHIFQIEQIVGQQQIVKISNIKEKFLYMKFGLREFVTIIANRYEKT